MYQPRRAAMASVAGFGTPDAAPVGTTPRHAVARPTARALIAPAAVSGTLIATVSALTLNVAATDMSSVKVDANTSEMSALSAVSSETEATAEPTYEATELRASATADILPGHQSADDPEPAKGKAAGKRYATTSVTIRTLPDSDTAKVGSLKKGATVAVTNKVVDGFRQVTYKGDLAYVADKYLTTKNPVEVAKTAAYTGSSTYTGKTVLGLKPKAMVVYNAVTARWSFSSIGGYRATSLSNHQFGGAIDFMLTPGKDSDKGWTIAKWVAANASKFGIDHIIFEQHIWTPSTPRWRPMADRGSSTANHMDHVHVSVKL